MFLISPQKLDWSDRLPFEETQPQLVIGIDGGGTKTVAWLADAEVGGRVLGRGFGGPSNQRAVGPVAAMSGIETAVAAAFVDAGLKRQTITAACLGLAGADRESDRRVVEQWAQDVRLADRIQVVNDALPLLFADGMSGEGVALIAGTGSFAVGRSATGQMARSGGWGWLFGDEGSAFALGRAVLEAVTRAADGRGPTTFLTDLVLDHFKVPSPSGIVAAVYGSDVPRSRIAELAPLTFMAARTRLAGRADHEVSLLIANDTASREAASGDAVAEQILEVAAGQLAEMVVSVIRRLSLSIPLPLAMTGAVLVRQETYRRRVTRKLTDCGVELTQVVVTEEAVSGALAMARGMM